MKEAEHKIGDDTRYERLALRQLSTMSINETAYRLIKNIRNDHNEKEIFTLTLGSTILLNEIEFLLSVGSEKLPC
jgi:hypothetical protein